MEKFMGNTKTTYLHDVFFSFIFFSFWTQPVYILEITNIQLANQPQSTICCVKVSCLYVFYEYVQEEFGNLMPLMNSFSRRAFKTHRESCVLLGIVLHELYAHDLFLWISV